MDDMFEQAKKGYKVVKPKTKERLCVTLPIELIVSFNKFVEDNGYDKSKLLEVILKSYLKI